MNYLKYSEPGLELDFLSEEETYLEQLFFDLDHDIKYMDINQKQDTLIDILNDLCDLCDLYEDEKTSHITHQ